MDASHLGEWAALFTAVCWTIAAIAFEVACKRAGALVVNWVRLFLGLLLLSIFCWIIRGQLLPLDAPPLAWRWLIISGVAGFAIGDLLLFRAFMMIGSRMAMLVMAFVPLLTAIMGWALMGETLGWNGLAGMTLTVCGITLVVLQRGDGNDRVKLSHPVKGILLALGGALGQSSQLVLSKYGMGNYDPFAATQIRIIAGVMATLPVVLLTGRLTRVATLFTSKRTLGAASLGALFGPFLGVALSLYAVQHTSTGAASTIMAIVPVLIIPPALILFREKITTRELAGAVIAVAGVAVIFLK